MIMRRKRIKKPTGAWDPPSPKRKKKETGAENSEEDESRREAVTHAQGFSDLVAQEFSGLPCRETANS